MSDGQRRGWQASGLPPLCVRAGLVSDETAMSRSVEALSLAEGNTDRPLS